MKSDFESQYHKVESAHWWFVGRRHVVRALVSQGGRDRHNRILEIGCSGGQLMKELQSAGFEEITGIDVSPDAIALCQEAGLNVRLMDAQQLDLPDASFDVITASDVLEHLRDDEHAVLEWKRVLKPGGLLIVFVPAFMFLWTEHDEANKHYRRYRRKDLIGLLRANGYTVKRSGYWNAILFAPIAVVRVLRRLWPANRQASGKGDLFQPPRMLNVLLTGLLRLENCLLRLGFNWPVGVSVMALAQKPGISQSASQPVAREAAAMNEPRGALSSRSKSGTAAVDTSVPNPVESNKPFVETDFDATNSR